LSRYKLKFSPDKIDTMIVQAVNLLDDLDKELNNYIMRLRRRSRKQLRFLWAQQFPKRTSPILNISVNK